MAVLGSYYQIDPALYQIALSILDRGTAYAKDGPEPDFCPDALGLEICTLPLLGDAILLLKAPSRCKGRCQRRTTDPESAPVARNDRCSSTILALFVTVAPAREEVIALLQAWRIICTAVKTITLRDDWSAIEVANGLARCWLRLLWDVYEVGRRTGQHGLTEPLLEFPEAILQMKLGHLALQYWITRCLCSSGPAANPGQQQSRFMSELASITAKADLFGQYIDRNIASRSLAASDLSIIESRRGIEVSVQAMKVTVKAERQAHAVSRLTQLAFIFLPLTFVTGVFGMNIQAFNDGAPIWKFWVALVCIAVPAFLFGMQTAREDVREQRVDMSKAARRRMARQFVSTVAVYQRINLDDWIDEGGFFNYSCLEHVPNYKDFLGTSRLSDVLFGVGLSAAFKCCYAKLKKFLKL